MAQEQLTEIQRQNLQFYQQREMAASQDMKTNIQSMRELIEVKKYSFEVGYTAAMEYTIEKLTGLVEPPDLNDQIMKQNEKIELLMQTQEELESFAKCSASDSIFDWRQNNGTTPVADQGACGSCWAFASNGAYEGNYRLKNGRSRNLSEQHLLDCNPWGYSCSGGWWAFDFFINNGVARESDYTYNAVVGTCNSSVAAPYKADSWGYVGSSAGVPSTTLIKQALCQHGPLSVAVLVTPLFQAYTSGVFDEPANPWTASTGYAVNDLVRPANDLFYICISPGITGTIEPTWPIPTLANPFPTVTDGSITWRCIRRVNHGVTLVGWDDNTNAWLIKNSWGTGWGDTCGYGTERGYMWISYDCDNIGFAAAWVEAVECHGCICP
jgi:C1A family cysteine protease